MPHTSHTVPLPVEALSHDGYIINQAALCGITNGCRCSDYNGCGWISVYNTQKAMGCEIPHDSLRATLSRGLILGGRFGTSPFFILRYLKRLGFCVAVTIQKSSMRRSATGARAIILFYFHRRGAHYVTLLPCADGRFRVLNLSANGDDIYTLDEVLTTFRFGLMLTLL